MYRAEQKEEQRRDSRCVLTERRKQREEDREKRFTVRVDREKKSRERDSRCVLTERRDRIFLIVQSMARENLKNCIVTYWSMA